MIKYFDSKAYVVEAELKYECSIYVFYHWYSIWFYAKQYHLVYYNEQRMYLVPLWSTWIFQCIKSLNIVQFVVRMKSKKIKWWDIPEKCFAG